MTINERQPDPADSDLARKNIRVAIVLALVALGFYVGFILMYV